MKSLIKTDLPRWSNFRWDDSATTPTLRVSIHRCYPKGTWRELTPNVALVTQYLDPLGVTASSFYGGMNRDFGFNGALKRAEGSQPVYVDFELEIPLILSDTGQACGMCHGTKRISELSCLHCHGTGHEWTHNVGGAFSKAASLSIMLAAIESAPEEDIDNPLNQTLTLSTCALPHENGVSLSATISPWLANSLRSASDTDWAEVERAMRETYLHCSENHLRSADAISAIWTYLDEGKLAMECPGDGTSPSSKLTAQSSTGDGYRLECKDLRSLTQQFTFLAGLGQLSNLFMDVR